MRRAKTPDGHPHKVSVVIPCFNAATTVGMTLDSLLAQTLTSWEAIVVNDGSTDDSAAVVRRYQTRDPRIQQIEQDNQGLGAARNTGLAAAKGEFLNFLDADDLLLPRMLERMAGELDRDPMAGAVHCAWICADVELSDFRWVASSPDEGLLFDLLAHQNLFPCHAVLMRRSVVDVTGPFDASLRHCHDWDLWLRVARAGVQFRRMSEPLVVYRMMPASLSRNTRTFFEAGCEVIRRGHRPDPRVLAPASETQSSCACPAARGMTVQWLLRCAGMAIARGQCIEACELVITVAEQEGLDITAQDTRAMTDGLWLGAAVPKGDWNALLPRISRPFLEFLVRQEQRLGRPGFAMQSFLEIIDWAAVRRRTSPDAWSGRDLLRVLASKITRRVTPHWLRRKDDRIDR